MYKVKLTEIAYNDLNEILFFIASERGSNEIALNYMKKLEERIMSLDKYLERCSIPRYKLLKLQGYRFLYIENHLIFYKIDQIKLIFIVFRVLHQRSAYQNFL